MRQRRPPPAVGWPLESTVDVARQRALELRQVEELSRRAARRHHVADRDRRRRRREDEQTLRGGGIAVALVRRLQEEPVRLAAGHDARRGDVLAKNGVAAPSPWISWIAAAVKVQLRGGDAVLRGVGRAVGEVASVAVGVEAPAALAVCRRGVAVGRERPRCLRSSSQRRSRRDPEPARRQHIRAHARERADRRYAARPCRSRRPSRCVPVASGAGSGAPTVALLVACWTR